MKFFISLLFIFLSTCFTICLAQKPVAKKTRISIFKDSVEFYRKLETLSKKRKLTYEIFRNIFVIPPSKKPPTNVKKQNENIYANVDGKIIRHIKIITLDPFGTDIADTNVRPISIFEKTGNVVHIKTKRFAIRNHLLFKNGDVADKLKLAESERIIRQSNYVADVTVRIDTNYTNKDSVDIIIREQDRWSINPSGNIGGGNIGFGLRENNFIGSGQQLEGRFFKRGFIDANAINYRLRYFVPYIKNTFITTGIFVNQDRDLASRGVSVGRAFYSPLTRWAGGVDISNIEQRMSLISTDSASIKVHLLRSWNFDCWAGIAFPLKKSVNYQDRTTKIVLAARAYTKHFLSSPDLLFDPLANLQNTTNYLATFGITQRGYYKDKYIYKYGVTEDVPVGKMIAITAGFQQRAMGNRFYLGIRSSYGLNTKYGYASVYGEYGTYINHANQLQQGVANFGFNGFTNLITIAKNHVYRQFFSVDVVAGLQRSKYERITINNVNGLQGFNPDSLVGSNKMVISTTAILYLPWQILGFRIAPILYTGFGLIGNEKNSFTEQSIYPVFGLGILIRNEYLIFSSFLISIGFIPLFRMWVMMCLNLILLATIISFLGILK